MTYYLRQDKKKRGIYLQMYDRYWDKEKKQARSKSIQAFGYLEDLISDEMPDPVVYYQEYVRMKTGCTISFRKRSRKSLQKLYADRVRVLGFERNDGSQVPFRLPFVKYFLTKLIK